MTTLPTRPIRLFRPIRLVHPVARGPVGDGAEALPATGTPGADGA